MLTLENIINPQGNCSMNRGAVKICTYMTLCSMHGTCGVGDSCTHYMYVLRKEEYSYPTRLENVLNR